MRLFFRALRSFMKVGGLVKAMAEGYGQKAAELRTFAACRNRN